MRTPGRGLVEITPQVARWLGGTGITTGLVTLFIRHTSASLLIQENADPEVQSDLERYLARLVPDGDPLFEHVSEGLDDMPAHVRAALTATTLSVPVVRGRMVLGTWQGSMCTSTGEGGMGGRWWGTFWVTARRLGFGRAALGTSHVARWYKEHCSLWWHTMTALKLIQIGDSVGVILPKEDGPWQPTPHQVK